MVFVSNSEIKELVTGIKMRQTHERNQCIVCYVNQSPSVFLLTVTFARYFLVGYRAPLPVNESSKHAHFYLCEPSALVLSDKIYSCRGFAS